MWVVVFFIYELQEHCNRPKIVKKSAVMPIRAAAYFRQVLLVLTSLDMEFETVASAEVGLL